MEPASPTAEEQQIAFNERALRNLKLTSDLFEFAYAVKRHQLQQKHPEFADDRLHEETMSLIHAARR